MLNMLNMLRMSCLVVLSLLGCVECSPMSPGSLFAHSTKKDIAALTEQMKTMDTRLQSRINSLEKTIKERIDAQIEAQLEERIEERMEAYNARIILLQTRIESLEGDLAKLSNERKTETETETKLVRRPVIRRGASSQSIIDPNKSPVENYRIERARRSPMPSPSLSGTPLLHPSSSRPPQSSPQVGASPRADYFS